MAEGRMLKRKITKSKKLAALGSDKARLLWFYMLPFTDVEGRIEADPEDIRDEIIRKQRKSFTLARIEECLQDLHRVGLIILYSVNGRRYLEFTKHSDEQTLRRDKEAESKIPNPSTGEVQAMDGTTTAISKVKISKVKISKVKISKEKERVFIAPSLQEIQTYVKEKKLSVNAQNFFDYFEAGGWIDSKGNKVRSWKQKLLTWDSHSLGRQAEAKTKLFPIPGKICSIRDCKLPAVYKDTSGAYDSYKCVDHLPAKVKEKYG